MSNSAIDTQTFTRDEMVSAFTSGFINGINEEYIAYHNVEANIKTGKAYALLYLEELEYEKEKINNA